MIDNIKKDLLSASLDTGQLVTITVSVPHGAKLPEGLSGQVTLQLGYNLPIPTIVDMLGTGFRCELSFNRRPYTVYVPWGALLYLSSPLVSALFHQAAPRRPALRAV